MSDIQSPDDAFRSNGATAERDESGRFLAGNKSSPGRKGGTRVKLSQKFFEALSADFEEHGVAAIARVRFLRPDVYVSVIAKLMPQKIEITNPFDELSDERLAEILDQLDRIASAQPGDNAKPVKVIEAQPFGAPPPTSAQIAAEAQRRDMLDQHDALAAATPTLPSQALPHPVGRAVSVSAREEERRNIAKLTDDSDLDPASLF